MVSYPVLIQYRHILGFSAILSLLLAIQSDLKREDKPVYFKEILIEKATKNNVICYDNLKVIQRLPELDYFLTTKYHTVVVGGGLGEFCNVKIHRQLQTSK